MKRFKLLTETTQSVNYPTMSQDFRIKSCMEESGDGEWVQWKDVAAELAKLEDRIPEVRIERLERKLLLVATGECACCGQNVRGWRAPSGSFAPEARAHLKECGINPATGHKYGCELDRAKP